MQENNKKGKSLFILYAIVSIILFFILFSVYWLNQIRFERNELYNLTRYQGEGLIQNLEIAWENAIISEVQLRNLLAERLVDTAYHIDELMHSTFDNPLLLNQLVKDTQIYRVIVTDILGRPILDSGPTFDHSPALPVIQYVQFFKILKMLNPILSGNQEKLLMGVDLKNPLKHDLLWIAVRRKTKPGLIIILVKSDYIDTFRSKFGFIKILRDIESKTNIKYLYLLDNANNILYPEKFSISPKLSNSLNFHLNLGNNAIYRFVKSTDGQEILEITHPFSIQGEDVGKICIGLPLTRLKATEKSIRSKTLLIGILIIIIGILGISGIFYFQFRNYSLRQIHEEEIQKKEKLASIGRLAAGVAHEIRNPLNAISMAIQRLQNEFMPGNEPEKKDFLNFTTVIRDEIKRVDKIISDFLNFKKEVKPVKIQYPMKKLIDDILTIMETEAEKNNITFEKHFENKDKTMLLCDPDQIKQCLINIIQNAIQAMPEGGKISIFSQLNNSEAIISISDTGPGIKPSNLDKIFEFYYSNKEGGVGLGLPISKKIIEEHGGKIEVKSEIGKGTDFMIYIPNNLDLLLN